MHLFDIVTYNNKSTLRFKKGSKTLLFYVFLLITIWYKFLMGENFDEWASGKI